MNRDRFEALPTTEKISILKDTISMLKVFRAPCLGTIDRNKRIALIETKIAELEKEQSDG